MHLKARGGLELAVKIMRDNIKPEERKNLVREINTIRRAQACPTIVDYYGLNFCEGDVWIYMELMEISLEKLYGVIGADDFPEDILAQYAVSIFNGLRYLKNELDVMHRDIKPSNTLKGFDGQFKICDFGISNNLEKSLLDTAVGCSPYLCPERINPVSGQESYGVESDVWSFGLTIVELAMKTYPYDGIEDDKNIFSLLLAIVGGEPPVLPARYSADFQDFVKQCLVKERMQRPRYSQAPIGQTDGAALENHPFYQRVKDCVDPAAVKAWYANYATAAGGGGAPPGPPDVLLPGAPPRHPQHRAPSAESSSSSSTAAPGSAANVDQALAVASSPVVREQSGEVLAAIQSAAARWWRATVRKLGGGGGGADGASNNSRSTRAEGKEGGETVRPPIEWIPNEILCIILSLLDARTLMTVVPQVCKFWRSMCQELDGVHLDFMWWTREIVQSDPANPGQQHGSTSPALIEKIPLEVVAGWRVADGAPSGAGADGTAAGGREQQERRWTSGMCALFPRTTSVTMGGGQQVEDAHLLALAGMCRGITHVDFHRCTHLTNAAVLELFDMCRGLTHVDFGECGQLTDAAVLGLAEKSRGRLTHATFCYCWNLTDAAVTALADKCRGLTHVNFAGLVKLTDAAVIALAKCRGLTHVDFELCPHLTDAAVVELFDKCRGITHAAFRRCRDLTDAAVLELAEKCRGGLTHADFGGCSHLTDAALLGLADKCCSGLTHADFHSCPKLTDAAVIELVVKCCGLTHANFGRCYNLTDAVQATVREQRPNCEFKF